MTGVKISVIGAGSVAWSSTLIRDLCMTPGLRGSTISLMDINEERLKLVHAIATRYAREVKADLKFEATLDRRESIKDADFVINTAMAGGHTYYERMRELSEAHGYYRGINSVEWNMVSDYHTIWGYYQFKLAMDIARDVEDLSPEAWLLQIANPVFELTTLISRKTKAKVIGLCHGHLGYREIAGALGLEPDKVEFEAIGFNHVIWLTKFMYDGEDAYPLIDEWIEKKAEEYWKVWREHQYNPFDVQMSPAAVDMYKVYGLFPVGDSVRGGTWKYHWDLKTKQKWFGPTGGADSEVGWKIYLDWQAKAIEMFKEAIADTKTPLTEILPPKRSHESVAPLIDSLVNDIRGVYQLNIPNQGSIVGIPDDVAVEVPAYADGRGIRRIYGLRLPSRIMKHVIWPRMMRMEWALEAFLEGGRDLLFEWLIVDPRTKSNEQVNAVIDAILSMPENKEMAAHFK
ncbi:MAG: alpha-glucosidase/alpha-galactosidase [Thermofilaceae archaeon]|nr:alpha-glucosidase/alpha-galactosidase [Thermofilaceae archaeon]MDW8003400.1 alpha-glucosidase/alpha-galactosidase [Thermofilaceae archaeon]